MKKICLQTFQSSKYEYVYLYCCQYGNYNYQVQIETVHSYRVFIQDPKYSTGLIMWTEDEDIFCLSCKEIILTGEQLKELKIVNKLSGLKGVYNYLLEREFESHKL